MFFEQIPVGTMKNFSYLVGDAEKKVCACIDPGWEAEKILEKACQAEIKISLILLTHTHADHSGAAEALSKRTDAPIFTSNKIPQWKETHPKFCVPKNIQGISEKERLSVGNIAIEVLETPGHQSDHLAFIIGNYLFTGDTLFIDTIGRTDLEDSEENKMKESLKKISHLRDNLIVCPGHDYGSKPLRKLREEKIYNPFLSSLSFY